MRPFFLLLLTFFLTAAAGADSGKHPDQAATKLSESADFIRRTPVQADLQGESTPAKAKKKGKKAAAGRKSKKKMQKPHEKPLEFEGTLGSSFKRSRRRGLWKSKQ